MCIRDSITDKRKLRRDRCDVFSTVAEGIKGKRAVAWNLVDDLAPLSKWDEAVARHAQELADEITERPGPGVPLPAIEWQESADDAGRTTLDYGFVQLALDPASRTADLTITAPDTCPTTEDEAVAAGAGWWVLEAWRQLDQAILELRMNFRDTALVLLRARGSADTVRATDSLLCSGQHWFVQETAGLVRRVLKRLDLSSKSFYAVADEGTTFTGTFLELLLAADRSYVLNDPDVAVHLGATEANRSGFPMSNGLTRLETRFYGTPEAVGEVLEHVGQADFDAETADELGLATAAPDDIDWEDELRLAIEERASFSPDALTGMESNLRFPGPETMETKIFGRLSAWQNWIFQRPNAVGERGALVCYGTPNRPEFAIERT